MHTPRFSGQPINAGDFVLLMTSSRPIRTSCENVGTVFPLFSATPRPNSCSQNFAAFARRADKSAREHAQMLKGLLRIRRNNQQETPYALQEVEPISWFSSERLTRLCGAGAPFRPLFRPIPSYFVPGPKMIPFQLTAPDLRKPPHS